MNYVFLIHAAESFYGELGPEKLGALMRDYGTYTHELAATGRMRDGAELEAVATSTCVRVRDGQRTVQDGPYAETREQLGGYYTFEAKDDDEAILWASRIPGATHGAIEVAPAEYVNVAPPATAARPAGKDYLLLVYGAESAWEAQPQAVRDENTRRYRAIVDELVGAGKFVVGARLESARRARTVRRVDDRRVVRDGPFAETREQLGGYFRVRAAHLDEVIALAARLPGAALGTIEIRPIRGGASEAHG